MNEMVGHWERLLPGRNAPEFTVQDDRGKEVRLSDYRGRYLYITVWATWCVPCKAELPYLDLLQKEYRNKNLQFLTVAVDDPGSVSLWRDFVHQYHYAGVHTIDESGKFNSDYMIISIPRFILIGPDGKLISSNAPRPSGQIRQLFDALGI